MSGIEAEHQRLLAETERLRARVAALERAEEHQRFLAEASRLLAGSLDYATTIERIARLAVPDLADMCILDALTEERSIRRLAVAHVDAEMAARVVRGRAPRYPPRLDAPVGVGKVLRTGEPEFYPDVPESFLLAIAQDGDHLALLRGLGFASYLVVPMVAHGQVIGAVSCMISTSERRYTPDDLRLAEDLAGLAALAVENARLYQAEQAARAQAEAAARQREEFLAIASHEVKTPLTALKGFVQLLDRRLRDLQLGHDPITSTVAQLNSQVARFETLVADLLDVSRIQQGRLDLRPTPTDLTELARQALARFEHSPVRTPRHTLRLDAPGPAACVVDPARLDQVLTNLISNALKYSPEGGEIRVAVQPRQDWIEVSVSDQGIGISPAEQADLFQPFARGEQASSTTGGTGLGLYIAAQIVTAHGGEIAVRSEPSAGSAFHVRLPCEPPASRNE